MKIVDYGAALLSHTFPSIVPRSSLEIGQTKGENDSRESGKALPHPSCSTMIGLVTFASLVIATTIGCGQKADTGPAPEVGTTSAKVSMPSPPSFSIPDLGGDVRSVKEMRVRGKKLIDTQVTVQGYVTWIYDCVDHRKKPGENRLLAKKRLAETPELCEKPHFYIGDSTQTSPTLSLWVVDVPRPLRKDEKRSMEKSAIAQHNARITPLKIGDKISVKGTWQNSAGGFSNSVGLLKYDSAENMTTAPAEGS